MEGERHRIDRERCAGCGLCASECFSTALTLKGRSIGLEEIMETILSDRAYYEESGGGVTLSGGEPVVQAEFAAAILAACKQAGLHTVLQTAGNYQFQRIESLLPYLDLIMYDIKAFSPELYKTFTGAEQSLVFENLRLLDKNFAGELAVRTPCVGGVNDRNDEIENIARMAGALTKIKYYQLIPYHGLARVKYEALDKQFAAQCAAPPPERVKALEDLAANYVTVFNQDRGFISRQDHAAGIDG
jgi:pyruvate formate lyase activating enzyme